MGRGLRIILFIVAAALGATFFGGIVLTIINEIDFTTRSGEEVLLRFVNLIAGFFFLLFIFLAIVLLFRSALWIVSAAAKEPRSKVIAVGVLSLVYFKSVKVFLVVPILMLISQGSESLMNGVGTNIWELQTRESDPIKDRARISDSNISDYEKGFSDGWDLAEENVASDQRPVTLPVESNALFQDLVSVANYYFGQLVRISLKTLHEMFAGENDDNFKHILLGFLFLFAAGFLCDSMLRSPNGNQDLINLFRARTNRINLLFVLIFFVGGFFSISAIIAIPVYQEGVSIEGFTLDNFKKKIDMDYRNHVEQSVFSVAKIDVGPIDTTKAFIEQWKSELSALEVPASSTSSMQVFLAKRRVAFRILDEEFAQLRKLTRVYENLQSTTDGLKNMFVQDLNSVKSKIEREYEASIHSVAIGNERGVFYNDCVLYLNRYAHTYKSTVQSYIEAVDEIMNSNEIQLEALKADLRFVVDQVSDTSSVIMPYRIPSSYVMAFPGWRTFTYSLQNSQLMPSFGEHTRNLGPFGVLANWLIETKSKEMILITGMLGFGLLGAGISSLIRDRTKVPSTMPLFNNNVTSTLVGGVSASLVIFLSLKGGTAVFTNNDVELNIYTVLLICLIGSVFSESVWEKAYHYINKETSAGSRSDTGGGGQAGEKRDAGGTDEDSG